MTHEEATKQFRDATADAPVGARERVWRRLEAPPTPARSSWLVPALALAASVLVGVVAVKVVRGNPALGAGTWSNPQSAATWQHARASVEGGRLRIDEGEVAVSSWGAPLELSAGGKVLRVERGVAVVRVAGDSVTAEVIEGALMFDGTTHTAPRGVRPTSALLASLATVESAPSRARRLLVSAERATAEQRFEDATTDLGAVAASGTLEAEVANFKKAELELRQLQNATRAVDTLLDGERRFPSGALTQERQLTLLESLSRLERWAELEERSSFFLSRFAQSERLSEVRALHELAVRHVKSP